jgi:hypothetical protein
LISRRPVNCPAALPLLGLPTAARNASTVAWIEAVVVSPPTENEIKPAMLVSGVAMVMAAIMSAAARPIGERLAFGMIYAPLRNGCQRPGVSDHP